MRRDFTQYSEAENSAALGLTSLAIDSSLIKTKRRRVDRSERLRDFNSEVLGSVTASTLNSRPTTATPLTHGTSHTQTMSAAQEVVDTVVSSVAHSNQNLHRIYWQACEGRKYEEVRNLTLINPKISGFTRGGLVVKENAFHIVASSNDLRLFYVLCGMDTHPMTFAGKDANGEIPLQIAIRVGCSDQLLRALACKTTIASRFVLERKLVNQVLEPSRELSYEDLNLRQESEKIRILSGWVTDFCIKVKDMAVNCLQIQENLELNQLLYNIGHRTTESKRDVGCKFQSALKLLQWVSVNHLGVEQLFLGTGHYLNTSLCVAEKVYEGVFKELHKRKDVGACTRSNAI